jgi:hypothetical protein
MDWTLVLRKAALGLMIEGPGTGTGSLITAVILLPEQGAWLLSFVGGFAGGSIGGCVTHAVREICRQKGWK